MDLSFPDLFKCQTKTPSSLETTHSIKSIKKISLKNGRVIHISFFLDFDLQPFMIIYCILNQANHYVNKLLQ